MNVSVTIDPRYTDGDPSLSIVHSMIDIHDGRYDVISETGEGRVFWFEISEHKNDE